MYHNRFVEVLTTTLAVMVQAEAMVNRLSCTQNLHYNIEAFAQTMYHRENSTEMLQYFKCAFSIQRTNEQQEKKTTSL